MKTPEDILQKHRQSGRQDWIYCVDALKAMDEYAQQQVKFFSSNLPVSC